MIGRWIVPAPVDALLASLAFMSECAMLLLIIARGFVSTSVVIGLNGVARNFEPTL